jgi:dTDP-4-dehydrorhamnose reductase
LNTSIPSGLRIFITGCNGLLGQKLTQLLAEHNSIFGVDLQPRMHLQDAPCEYFPQDITRRDEILELVARIQPNYIINTAAMTDVDGCEEQKDRCWRINVLAVEHLIRAAKKVKAHLIHISSDYVFDGTHPPYREEDPTKPLGFYGKSKLASENELRGADVPHTIIRTQVLYGVGDEIRPNFVDFVLRRLQSVGVIKIVADQRGNPTLADDLASGIARVIQLQKEGIFHISGSESATRYDFARQIAVEFGEDPDRIQPIKTAELAQKSPRPADSTFVLDKIARELSFTPRGIREGLREFHRQWEARKRAHGGDTQ